MTSDADDDMMDDALENSMELRESASYPAQNIMDDNNIIANNNVGLVSNQSDITTDKSTPATNTNNVNSSNITQTQQQINTTTNTNNTTAVNNKINTTSPAKLNSKFQ